MQYTNKSYTKDEIIKANAKKYNELLERKTLLEYLYPFKEEPTKEDKDFMNWDKFLERQGRPKTVDTEIQLIEHALVSLRSGYDYPDNRRDVGEKYGIITPHYGKDPDEEIDKIAAMTKENDEIIKNSGLEDKKNNFVMEYQNPDELFEEYKKELEKTTNSKQVKDVMDRYVMKWQNVKYEDEVNRTHDFYEHYNIGSSRELDLQTVEIKKREKEEAERKEQELLAQQRFNEAKQKYDNLNVFKKAFYKFTGKAQKVDGQYIVEENDSEGMKM